MSTYTMQSVEDRTHELMAEPLIEFLKQAHPQNNYTIKGRLFEVGEGLGFGDTFTIYERGPSFFRKVFPRKIANVTQASIFGGMNVTETKTFDETSLPQGKLSELVSTIDFNSIRNAGAFAGQRATDYC